jgi:hypothetical protein
MFDFGRDADKARAMTFAATILTLYPEMFPGPFGHSIAGRAMAEGTWACETGGHYSRPDVLELQVDTGEKEGIRWN